MSKRLVQPKGPANMKKNFIIQVPTILPSGEEINVPKLTKGYAGVPGWAYHPTRGFKKVHGFKPESLLSVSQPIIPEAPLVQVVSTE
jgi:hypothetical protein